MTGKHHVDSIHGENYYQDHLLQTSRSICVEVNKNGLVLGAPWCTSGLNSRFSLPELRSH